LSRALGTLRDQGEVARLVLDTVTQTLNAATATLWLRHAERAEYHPVGGNQLGVLPADGPLPAWLSQWRHPWLPAADDASPQAAELRHVGGKLAVPLWSGERLPGILTLGERRAGLAYTADDLQLLNALAHSAALALENARLHEERITILREQLAQAAAAREEERQRIAGELRDGVSPTLASMNLRLRTAGKLLAGDDPAAREMQELAEQARSNIQNLHRLVVLLNNP